MWNINGDFLPPSSEVQLHTQWLPYDTYIFRCQSRIQYLWWWVSCVHTTVFQLYMWQHLILLHWCTLPYNKNLKRLPLETKNTQTNGKSDCTPHLRKKISQKWILWNQTWHYLRTTLAEHAYALIQKLMWLTWYTNNPTHDNKMRIRDDIGLQ